MLDGKIYRNNSAIPLTEIGEGDNALHCTTDKEECSTTPTASVSSLPSNSRASITREVTRS